MSIPLIKVHIARKISHSKNTLIWKAFQSRVKWRFLFVISNFVPEIFKFSYYANLATDDVIGCASYVGWCDRKLRISPPTMKQCYWNLVGMLHPIKYTRWYTFWCCYGNMLGSSQNEILSFRLNKAKYLVLSETHASPTFITSPLKHPVQL